MIRVMVVDDEVPIRQWLEFCISRLDGYEVCGSAANGAEGYSLFRKHMPDVVITDIRMPVMDGLEMLKLIQTVRADVVTVVLTSHEDFEYARKAMKLGTAEYILKTEITEEGLKELLDKCSSGLTNASSQKMEKTFEEMSNRNHYLRSLVLNRNAGVSVTEKHLSEYEIDLEKSDYIAIDVMTGEEDEGPVKIVLPKEELLIHMVKVPLDVKHTIILGNLKKDGPVSGAKQQEQIDHYCRQLLQQLPCKIGCSDIYNKPLRLGEAMCQAYDRVCLQFYQPNTDIFRTQPVGSDRIEHAEKYKIRFSKELVNQNFKKAMEIKDSLIADAGREQVSDINYVKELYLFFLTSLYHMTRDDVDRVEEQLMQLGQQVQDAKSFETLNRLLEQGFEDCCGSGMDSVEYSAPVRSAVHYLEEHYMESPALGEVAACAGVSSEYLSRLFKEETGVKFVVYLNNLRLKHALRLLETTNLKVYEVAEQVGYSNLSYFSTVFKKNFGQNPFDYKNNYGR